MLFLLVTKHTHTHTERCKYFEPGKTPRLNFVWKKIAEEFIKKDGKFGNIKIDGWIKYSSWQNVPIISKVYRLLNSAKCTWYHVCILYQ